MHREQEGGRVTIVQQPHKLSRWQVQRDRRAASVRLIRAETAAVAPLCSALAATRLVGSSVRLSAPRERAVKNLLEGVERRFGRPAGDGRKTDASFALEEELLARYEEAKVTADKP
ncbi:hypothetical protein ALC62_14981 [Cyphomyrmex costatus]|uniref:Uncharacterized protein n=1 Tax=Cyphomyrmex costatus TaxID=456900 RepID=A0A195C2X6_9HYME|nr:hypothetical protein ALC62_14981 [Cyphomyrmex costatus]